MRRAAAWLLAALLAASCAAGDALAPARLGLSAAHAAHAAHDPTAPGVCQSMDIRNSPSALQKLRGCRVVEGVLQVVLIETHHSAYANYSFPELREITGYLVLYRLGGLKSVGELFPNLTVIRGMQLFKDYALVIYENDGLETIGLTSLTDIMYGSVRIEHNGKLCYVNTVDWSKIAPGGSNVIDFNRDEKLCGVCPGDDVKTPKNEGTDTSPSRLQCPSDTRYYRGVRHLCWNADTCQKVCPEKCGNVTCRNEQECCDSNCLGGCRGPTADDCFSCRHLELIIDGRRRCVKECPTNYFKHLSRRCISEQECRSLPLPKPTSGITSMSAYAFKPINGTCMYECPIDHFEFKEKNGTYTCKPCQGPCIKVCGPGKIDSIESAQKFRGCTNITGSLEISIKGGGNIVHELEENLGYVTEIEGMLKVSRSYPLITLQFLRSLRVIRGKFPEGQAVFTQAMYIFDNPNLEELWDWDKHGKIDIQHGNLFFHFNPKLCYHQIYPLKAMAKGTNFTEQEVSRESNGEKATCEKSTLDLTISLRNVTAIVLRWDHYCPEDLRVLLGYSVYYLATDQNVTIFDERDACGDSWSVDDIPIEQVVNWTDSYNNLGATNNCSGLDPLFHPITRLKPYTRYAVYVKTYTIQNERKGGQSPIVYFTTLPGRPSLPAVEVESVSPTDIKMHWRPPQYPNGKLKNYYINITWIPADKELKRDYCTNPVLQTHEKVTYIGPKKQEEVTEDSPRGKCKCDSKPGSVFSAEKYQDGISFENSLQNKIFIRNIAQSHERLRRSIDVGKDSYMIGNSSSINSTSDSAAVTRTHPKIAYINGTNYYSVYFTETNGTEFKLSGLQHYSKYTISVWACRAFDPDEYKPVNNSIENCSIKTSNEIITQKSDTADNIKNVTAEVEYENMSTRVKFKWTKPAQPNGFVVSYVAQYSKVDGGTPKSQQSCVAHNDEDPQLLPLVISEAGNYSFIVAANSLAGQGPWSEKIYFVIKDRPVNGSWEIIIGVCVGIIVIMFAVLAGVWYVRRGLLPVNEGSKLFASVNPEYVSAVYVPDEWEVPRSNIEFVKELGQGSFGMVYEGIARDIVKGTPEMRCAIKTVNEHATDRERVDFLNEASVMKAFDTWHVVRLLGVVSQGQPTLVVMELMERGDLKSYLRSHRPEAQDAQGRMLKPQSNPATLQRIKQMAIEIADGMAYLSAKKFVHRDLAARNCMVAGDLTVKVGDFGMTRDIYETDYYRKGSKGLLPVRWMSPESLKDGVFSSNSDVWSYGVVLWEMATLAMQPYQGLSNEQVLRYVVEGGVMERPDHCPNGLYELMRSCWAHRPTARPSFLSLVAALAPDAAPYFRQRAFFYTPQAQELYAQQQAAAEEEDLAGPAVAASGSNSLGVTGRLASWVRELASLRASPELPAGELQALVGKAAPPNGLLPADRDTSLC